MFLRVISTGSKAGNCYALISDSGQILLLDFGCDKKKSLEGLITGVRMLSVLFYLTGMVRRPFKKL